LVNLSLNESFYTENSLVMEVNRLFGWGSGRASGKTFSEKRTNL